MEEWAKWCGLSKKIDGNLRFLLEFAVFGALNNDEFSCNKHVTGAVFISFCVQMLNFSFFCPSLSTLGYVWTINLVWAVAEYSFLIRTHLPEMIGNRSFLGKLEQLVIKQNLANVKNNEVIKFMCVECHICSKEKKKLRIDHLFGYYV